MRVRAIVLIATVYACTNPLSYSDIALRDLQSLSMIIGFNADRTSGTLWVFGGPIDSMLVPRDEDRLSVIVTTSTADTEYLVLKPRICKTERLELHVCNRFLVEMDSSHSLAELAPLVSGIDGTLEYTDPFEWGIITISDGPLEQAMYVISRWPNVRVVKLDEDLCYRWSCAPTYGWDGFIDIVPGGRAMYDGKVQAAPGDTLYAHFVRPNNMGTITMDQPWWRF